MKSKQEVISEAWEQYGIPYSEKYVDENGFIAMKQDLPEIVDGALLSIRYSTMGHNDFDHKGGLYRPVSLRGIENNRGWTRIESVDALPKEDGDYFVVWKVGDDVQVSAVSYDVDQPEHWNGVTHYQPIIKPGAPLY